MFQLAAQFGPMPGASNSSQQSSAAVSSTRGSGSQTSTPSKRASRKRARTPKKSSTQTSSSMYPGEDHPGSMSSTVSAGMPDENITLDQMQDRMERILDARLSQSSNKQERESLAFTSFLHECLPDMTPVIFSQFITNVTAYTRRCLQLSREDASHQKQGPIQDVVDVNEYLTGPTRF